MLEYKFRSLNFFGLLFVMEMGMARRFAVGE